jgi:hypothetical protein
VTAIELVIHTLPIINVGQRTPIAIFNLIENTAKTTCPILAASLPDEPVPAALNFSNHLLDFSVRLRRDHLADPLRFLDRVSFLPVPLKVGPVIRYA